MPGADPDADDGHAPLRLKDMSRRRLINYVQQIIRTQNIPLHEIVCQEVLPYLPAMTLLRFRAVCPSWRAHISTPSFQHRQSNTHRSLSGFILCNGDGVKDIYLPFDPTAAHNLPHPNYPLEFLLADKLSGSVHALASSYGLILASKLTNRRTLRRPAYTVCNPTTAQWARIPRRPEQSHDGVALVFEPSDRDFFSDYLVVSTFCDRDDNSVPPRDDRKFVVFCSRAEKWRPASKIALPGKETALSSPHGIAAGGKAYWKTVKGKILSYDPGANKADVLDAPPETSMDRAVVWQLGELTHRLCCVSFDVLQGALVVSALVFDDYAGKFGWEKLQTIDVDPLSDARPLMFHGGDSEVVVLIEGVVMAYKAATGEGRILCEAPLAEFEFLPYISSLVVVKKIRRAAAVTMHNESHLTKSPPATSYTPH